MLFKCSCHLAQGIALIWIKKNVSFFFPKRYYCLRLSWAAGGEILANNKVKINWRIPWIRFYRMRTAPNAYPRLRHLY